MKKIKILKNEKKLKQIKIQYSIGNRSVKKATTLKQSISSPTKKKFKFYRGQIKSKTNIIKSTPLNSTLKKNINSITEIKSDKNINKNIRKSASKKPSKIESKNSKKKIC